MKLIIESIHNGWTVGTDDGENYHPIVGFTYDEDFFDNDQGKANEVKKFAQLLQYINDMIGPTTSRYDSTRIYVKTASGDKYEPSSKGEGASSEERP